MINSFNNKIKSISSLIDNNNNVIIDVGCDHCLLCIYLLINKKIKFSYNVDINKLPLSQGIKNIEKFNLIDSTKNIINNGLKNINVNHEIDYIIIAGMGANNIIDILSDNLIDSKFYIVQPNNNLFKLKKFLFDNNYQIINELYVKENDIIYPILKLIKSENIIRSNENYFFSEISKIKNTQYYFEYLNSYFNHIQKYIDKNKNKFKQEEYINLKKYLNKQ